MPAPDELTRQNIDKQLVACGCMSELCCEDNLCAATWPREKPNGRLTRRTQAVRLKGGNRMKSFPASSRVLNSSRGRGGGPLIFLPEMSKCPSWQGLT